MAVTVGTMVKAVNMLATTVRRTGVPGMDVAMNVKMVISARTVT